MIQPMTLPVGLIFYLDYKYGGDARARRLLEEAGVKVWEPSKHNSK